MLPVNNPVGSSKWLSTIAVINDETLLDCVANCLHPYEMRFESSGHKMATTSVYMRLKLKG